MITDLQDCLEEAYAKIDDLENCARHYNFRFRCLPETVKDAISIILSCKLQCLILMKFI